GNGVDTANVFSDTRGLLNGVTTKFGATQYASLAYTRDDAGRVTGVTNGAVTSNTENWNYGYDDLGELITADNVGQSSQDRSYAYDLAGNMTCNSGIDSSIANASRKTYCQSNTNIAYPPQGAGSVRPHAPASIVGQSV